MWAVAADFATGTQPRYQVTTWTLPFKYFHAQPQ
jgi:hypothetical protein